MEVVKAHSIVSWILNFLVITLSFFRVTKRSCFLYRPCLYFWQFIKRYSKSLAGRDYKCRSDWISYRWNSVLAQWPPN